MKKHLLTALLIVAGLQLVGQPSQKLAENESLSLEGIECTYRINQESTKKSGDAEYSRYVLEFYIVNRSNCNRYIPYHSSTSESSTDNLVATFYVKNANGKRFTNRDARLGAKPWWVGVKVSEKDSNGKNVTRLRDMQAGYVFRKGDQLKAQITVLVPMGSKPDVEVALAYLPDN